MILMRKQLGQEAIGGCLPSLFFVRWKMKKGLRDGLINQSIIVYTLRIKSLLPSLYKREEFPSLEKRG